MVRPQHGRGGEVVVRFRDAALLLDLPAGTTLEDLAQRVADRQEGLFGVPLSIELRLRQ